MASGFNLTAQLNLRGPSNIADIVSDIKKQIGSIKADVNLKIDSASIQNVAKLNSVLGNLNKTLSNTASSVTNVVAAIRRLGSAMGQVGAGTVSKDMDAVARAASRASKAMQVTSRQTSQAASEMVEFGRVSGLAIRRFAAFSTVTGAVYALTNAINQGVSAYIEYDRQLIKLQQITGESASGLRGLEEAITSLSVGLGVSSADLTDIASTLAQAGLNARDTERALKALALSALAPSFDSMNETVEGSIALMRQFGISASELEQSLGSVNAVAARFAVEASDLITAIQRTGGVFATASRGVSEGTDALNEFLAVFTSVRATTRESAETIATGLRTIFTRIQRGDTIEALKAYGVNLTDLDGKFVGAYKAVELLSKGLSTLDPRDLRFSQIVEELGGFRQIGKVIPLIQQFATAQDALRVAQQGQGSLAEDAAKAQLSLAIQTAKVKQEFLALFREIGKSDSFQTIAKGALSLASGLIKVADSVKGVLPVLGVIMAFKGASAITQFAGGFSRGVRGIGGAKGLGERMGGGGSRMSQGGRVRYFASGGLVPGSGDTDSVPAMLTPGEFVINKKAVQSVGPDKLHKINKYKRGGTVWSQVDPGSGSKTYGYEFSHLDKGLTPTLKRANNVEGVGISNLGVMLPRTMNQLMKSGNISFFRDEIVSDLRKKLRIKDNQPLYVPKRDLITEISDQTPVELFSSLLAVKMPKNQAPKTRLASNARELDLYKEQKLLADNYSANTSSGARSSKAGSLKGGVADSNLSRTDVLANLKKVLLQSAGALPERLTKDEDLHPLAVGLGTFAQEKWVPELLDIREIEVTGKRARGAGRQSWAAKDFLMPKKEKTIETEKSPYKYIYNDGGLVARFTDGGKTKTRKPKEVFGTGETTFPLRVRKKYAEEKQRSDENIRAKLAWDDYPKDERVTVDESKTQAAFQQPFDRAKFIESFKQKITRNTLFSRMSDFAKLIGLPQEDLTVALPLQVDFGGSGMDMFASAQFSKGARGTRSYEGYDLSKFGFGEKEKQELYGLEKLIETKQKEIKKITKTPTRTFDDGSFSYDDAAYTKANNELRDLKNKSFKLRDLKQAAEKAALSEQDSVAASTGRGSVSFAKPLRYGATAKNDVLYHELTHQLFEGLRTRSADSFSKYRERVTSLFSGDNDDLADAFDALTSDSGYSSADVVYGRSYKLGYLRNMLSSYYRQNLSFDSDRVKEPVPEDITKNLASLSSQSEGAKRAREYRPINPKVNEALLTGKYAIGQDVINRMEDNGKEEFLTTLVQKAPQLDQNLQGVLDSTLTELLGGAGIQRQQYATGGYVQRFAVGGKTEPQKEVISSSPTPILQAILARIEKKPIQKEYAFKSYQQELAAVLNRAYKGILAEGSRPTKDKISRDSVVSMYDESTGSGYIKATIGALEDDLKYITAGNTERGSLKKHKGVEVGDMLDTIRAYQALGLDYTLNTALATGRTDETLGEFQGEDLSEAYKIAGVDKLKLSELVKRMDAAAQYKFPEKLYSGLGDSKLDLILKQTGTKEKKDINSLIGKTFNMPSFLSSSDDEASANSFARVGMLTILTNPKRKGIIPERSKETTINRESQDERAKKSRVLQAVTGQKGMFGLDIDEDYADAYDSEGEYIFPSNSKFKINSIEKNTTKLFDKDAGYRHIDMEVQQLAKGGVVQRKVGYIDYDVIANPDNEAVVKRGMEATGMSGPRLYTDHLTQLAVQARKDSNLQKLRAVYGVAGSGKTTLARGQGTDDAKLRKTERFPILSPQDIQRATEVIVLSSSVSKDKLDNMFDATDRTYTLSSTTKEEKDRVRSQRGIRDTTGVGLEGRKPGSTASVSTDTAVGEALLADRLGDRSVVLGRSGSGRTRRKQGNELVEVIKKKIGFTWGGYSPMTAGHESILDAATAMGIAPEDFIYLVGSNEGITPGKEETYRTAIFDQDTRVLLAKAGAGARGATVLPKPRDFEVPQAFDVSEGGQRRKVLVPAKGSSTFVADKTAQETEKYKAAGYNVQHIERTGGISGTMVRQLIKDGNLGELQKVLSPGVYDLISNNIGRIQNRANILPSIIEEVQQTQGVKLADIEKQIKAVGISRIDNKKVATDPEYAAKVEVLRELREKRDQIKSAASFEPHRLLSALAAKEPDKYGLDLSGSIQPNIKSMRTLSAKPQKVNLGGMIQRFEEGGAATELVLGNSVAETAAKNSISKQQAILEHLAAFKGIKGVRAAARIPAGERRISSVLRKNNIEQGNDLAEAEQYINQALSARAGAAAARKKDIKRSQKLGLLFGAAGVLGNTFSPIKKKVGAGELKEPVDVYVTSGTLDPKVALRFESILNTDIDKTTRKAAKRVMVDQIMAQAGLGKTLQLDFDKTLAFGADKIDLGPDSKKPKFAAFSDRTKVQEGLGSARLSILGKELVKLTKERPDLLNNMRVVTARPQSTLDLVQSWLSSKGLPIPLSQFTGVGGTSVSEAQVAKLKAAVLAPDSVFVDDNKANINAARQVSKANKSKIKTFRYGLQNVKDDENREGTTKGNIFERVIESLGGPKADKAFKGIDFPQGLKSAAKYFGIRGDIPTDAKRTLNGPSTVEDNIVSYLKTQGYKNGGAVGKASRKVDFEKNVGPSPFEVKKTALDYYSLEKSSGFSSREFDELARYAKTNDFSLDEFRTYLLKRKQEKQNKAGLRTDTSTLRASLIEGSKTTTDAQRALAKSLMGPPDAGYRPMRRYADGGHVAALLTPGEAVISPKLAKKIGYGKLARLNKADQNGMGKFAEGGGVGIVPGSGNSDTFGPVPLEVGTFVIRKKATEALGLTGYNLGGVVQRFEDGGSPKVLPLRPDIISRATVSVDRSAEEAMKKLIAVIKELGIESSNTAKLVNIGGNISYKAAEKAMVADLQRAKTAGGSIDQILAAEQALADVRKAGKADVAKRNVLQNTFASAANLPDKLSAGEAQQQIISMANNRASKQIDTIEQSRVNKNTKTLINEKKTQDYDQIVEDLTRKAMAGSYGPLTAADTAQIEQEASKRVMQRSTAGKYNLTEAEQKDIKSKSVVSDEEKQNIYRSQTLKATSSVTGVSKSELTKSGVGADDIRRYAQESMMDRKTLAQMDAQYRTIRMAELQAAGKTASEAKKLVEQELKDRRAAANAVAKEKGIRGPGGTGIMGAVGRAGLGAYDKVTNLSSRYAQTGMGKFTASMTNNYMAGAAIAALGGQSDNIASLLGGSKETQAGTSARIQSATSTIGAGLTLATSVAGIPGIGPLAAAATLAGTGLMALVGSAKAAADAQKAYADSLKTKKFEDATDLLSKAMDNLSKDVNSLDLQSAALTAVKGYVEASSGTTSVAIDARKKEANQERINKMGTGEYLSSFIFDNSYLQNIAGMKTSEQTTVLGADDYAKIAAKEAPKNEEGNRAALQLLEQEIKKSGNPEETFNKIITEDVFKPLREAMARAKPETLAQIIQIEEKMAKTKDAATIAELQKKKEGIITESARNNKMLEQIKKTDELNRAMEAADKAGRQLARTFESMARSVSQAIGRSKFETESMEDGLPNDGKLRSRRSRDANILENPNAYSDAERAAANKNVANRIYNTGAAGLAPEERKRRQDQADKVEKALGFDSFTFANRATGAGNLKLGTNANAEFKTVADAAGAQIMADIASLPEEMQQQIKDKFDSIKQDVDNNKDLGDRQKADALLRKIQDELGQSASDAAEKVKKMALDVEGFATDSLNRFVDATNRAVDAQLKAEDAYRKARDIRTESDVALRETVSGGSIGLGERANIIDAKISSMTGGLTDPQQIKAQIGNVVTDDKGNIDLNKSSGLKLQMAQREEKRNKDLAGVTNQEDRLKIETQAASDMAQMSKQIQSSQKALEELANSTDLATAAMNQLQAIQGLQKERLQTLDQVLTSSPQELKKFNESLIRVQQRAMGINPNPSKEARKAYNQALRQSGGNRRVATMAAQEQMAQDRAMDLRTMEQMRAEFVNSKMIGGMSQEDANKMYNQGAANVRGQMAFESGIATGPYGVGAMNIIRESADPLSNPAAKAAADSYNQANQRQATANEALAQQAVEDSKQILQVASNQLAEVLVELAKRIAEIDQKIAKDLAGPPAAPGVASSAAPAGDLADLGIKVGDTPPGAPITRPEPVRVASKGGVIYARLGKLIDFKPQGTDTVPAMLTPGEFVVNAKATAQHLPLLKAINSGSDAIVSKTMNKGGVVYLAEGGRLKKDETIEQDRAAFEADVQTQGANYGVSQEDQQEAARLRDERDSANQELMFMQSGAMVDESARQWTQEQFGSKWDGMTEEQRNAEIQKNLPRFQQLGQDYTARRDAYVAQKGSEDEATGLWSKDRFTTENQLAFFRQERERSEAAAAAASQAEYDQQTKMREANKSAQDSKRAELDRRQKVEDARQIAYGEKEIYVANRKVSVDGKGNFTISDWKPGEREAVIQKRKDEALAIVNAEEQKQGLSITASVGVPQSTGAAQQADQANKSKEQAQTRAEESKATQQQTSAATAQTQQPQFKMTDAQMYAKQASDLAPKEMKDFRKPRSMGEVQMYREGLARGMTIDEIKYERQQAYLSQFRPDVRASKEKSLGRGLVAPSERITAIQKSREAQLKQKQGGDPYADQKAQAASTPAPLPPEVSPAEVSQARSAVNAASTENTARQVESPTQRTEEQSEEPKGPLLESAVSEDKKDRYAELEAKRSKGRYSLTDPLTPEERKEWTALYRQRELGAVPTANDNARRLALMGIAPRDRTPEQQEEYLRLRYQSDSYRASQGQKKTISGATADENFASFKERVAEEQYARDDKRYDALSQKDPGSLAEYDRQFLKDYVKQQSDRQNKVLSDMSQQDAAFGGSLQDIQQGLAANETTLADAKSRSEEYKKSKEFQEDQATLANIEQQRQQAHYKQFISEQVNAGIKDPELLAEAWASHRGLDQIEDPADRQRMLLSYEKEAADFIRSGSAEGGLSDAEFSELGERFKEGKELSPQDKRELINQKFAEEQQKKQDDINQRVFGSLAKLDDRASSSNIDKVREQARTYAQAADRLSRIKNVDNKAQIEAFRAKAEELDGLASRFKVSGYGTEDTQAGVSQVQQGLRVSGSQLEQMAADSKLMSVRSDKGIDQYATDKRVAAEQEQARVAAEKAAEEARIRAAEQAAERQRQEAIAAEEKKRKDSMWINSSNPLLAGLGYLGGVTQAAGDVAYGAANVVAGATVAAVGAIASPLIDDMTGQAYENARAADLNARIKANQEKNKEYLGVDLATAQSRVEDKGPTAAQAFRNVGLEAAAQGAYTAVEFGQALVGQGPAQTGEKSWLYQGDDKRVEMAGELGGATRVFQNIGYTASQFGPGISPTTTIKSVSAVGRGVGRIASPIVKAVGNTSFGRGVRTVTNAVGDTVRSSKYNPLSSRTQKNFIKQNMDAAYGVTATRGDYLESAVSQIAKERNLPVSQAEKYFGKQARQRASVAMKQDQIRSARYDRLTGGDPTKASGVLRGRAARLEQLKQARAAGSKDPIIYARVSDRKVSKFFDDINAQEASDNVAYNNFKAAQARRNDPSRIARRERMKTEGLARQAKIQKQRDILKRKEQFANMTPEEKVLARTKDQAARRGIDYATADIGRAGSQLKYGNKTGYRALQDAQNKSLGLQRKASFSQLSPEQQAASRLNNQLSNRNLTKLSNDTTASGNPLVVSQNAAQSKGALRKIRQEQSRLRESRKSLDFVPQKDNPLSAMVADSRTQRIQRLRDQSVARAEQLRLQGEDLRKTFGVGTPRKQPQTPSPAVKSAADTPVSKTMRAVNNQPKSAAMIREEVATRAQKEAIESGRVKVPQPTKPSASGTVPNTAPTAPATPTGLPNDILARISRGEGYMDGNKFVPGKRPSSAVSNAATPVQTNPSIAVTSDKLSRNAERLAKRQKAIADGIDPVTGLKPGATPKMAPPPPASPAAKAQAQAEAVAARHRKMEGTEYSWPSKPAPEGTPGIAPPVIESSPIQAGAGASVGVVKQVAMRQKALAERLGAYASSDEAAKALKQSGAFNIKSVEVADALTARNTGGDSAVRAAGAAYSPSTRSVKMTKGRLGSQSADAVIDHELAHAMQHNTVGGLSSKTKGGPLAYEQKLMDSLGLEINDFLSSPKGYQALRDAAGKDAGIGSLYTADRIKMEPVELFTSLVQASAGKDFNKNKQAVDMLKKLMKFHGYAKGGIVYANNGALIEARPQGTDTVPAMLTPGEFVVNRQAAQQHMPVLQAINKGYYNQGGIVKYLANGGIVAPQYHAVGGVAKSIGNTGSNRDKNSLDMEAIKELAGSMSTLKEVAGSIGTLKDAFGPLENLKDFNNNLKESINQFGTHVDTLQNDSRTFTHDVKATVMQHVTGIDGAEAKYAKQFQGNMEQVASDHVAKAEYNRQKLNEQNPGDAGQIIRHV